MYAPTTVVPPCDYPRDASVQELFEAWAERSPDSVAVRCQSRGSLTYAELNARANRLAANLQAAGVGPACYVGMLLPRTEHAVVAMLGILKAGGAYVPLDPRDPKARRDSLADDLGLTVVVTESALADEVGDGRRAVLVEEVATGPDLPNPARQSSGSSVAYVLFTSGSTGKPKGVAVPHRAIVRLVVGCDFYTFSPSDRVSQSGPLTFDASTLEIWAPLLTGGRVVMAAQETLLSPEDLDAFVRDEEVTVLWLTTALFHQLAASRPQLFAGLRCVLFGGETCDARRVRQVLEHGAPQRLVHCYGPTENTVFSTTFRVEELAAGETVVPIGFPVHASTAHVLDAARREVPAGDVGELYVGGDGVALEYVNRPELTAEAFVPDPFSPLPGARMYRTGDYARRRPDGALDFCGRRDHQVKIRGFRIELTEVEAVLGRAPGIGHVLVMAREDTPGDKRLVAYVTASTGVDAQQLRQVVARQLPSPMVPSAFVVLDRFPLTLHGKIDRQALPAPSSEHRRGRSPVASLGPVEAAVAELWGELLDVDDLTAADDFFGLGGHSLLAARMVTRVRDRFGIHVRHTAFLLRRLLATPTLGSFAEAITTVGDDAGATRTAADYDAEATLDASIRFGAPRVEPASPRRVFLTGVSGFLGAFLLRELLERTDATVYCHIRAGDVEHGLSRIIGTLESYRLWSERYRSRIVAVPGDLAQPLLGLSAEEFDRLAGEVDLIIHNGAHVNFIYSYEALKAANVGGNQEVIRLATQRSRKPLHFVSSLGVAAGYGLAGTRWVTEAMPLAHPDRLHLGYLEAKYVAELLVTKAGKNGLPVAIYRPLDISGHQETGVYKTEGTFVCEFIQAIVELGCAPDINKALDFVPVDYVSGAIVHIATSRPADGSVYHINNPRFALFGAIVERLEAMGYPVRTLDYESWVAELVRFVDGHPDSAIAPYAHLFAEKHHEDSGPDGGQEGGPQDGPGCSVERDLTVVQMHYQGILPRFDCTRTLMALEGAGITCPPVDADLLDRYLRYFIAVGFLPEPASGLEWAA